MSIVSRIRSLFGKQASKPAEDYGEASYGQPSPGKLMDRGGGELAGAHDHEHDDVRRHDLGAPNDPIGEHVRPHIP